MAGDKILTIDKNNFEELVLKSDKPVLVDFWAAWCGPCRMVAPILEEISGETDAFVIGKVDVDANPELAGDYKVMSIPTLILFANGAEKKRLVGAKQKAQLLEEVNSAI